MFTKKIFTLILALAFIQIGNNVLAQPDDTKEEMVYDMPEQMPEFPGGATAMERFINDNIKYPPVAKEAGIQGKVYVQFVVEKNGDVTNVKVRRGAHKALDTEAVRVVELMPNWKPGSMRGRKVRVRYTLPITFALS